MIKNILLTGMPKSGKSTLLRKTIKEYSNKVGFVTNEVRLNSERVGFEMEAQNGVKIPLSNVNFKSDFKVSKYFVDVSSIGLIIPYVSKFNTDDLLYLDEIGEMQLFSEDFKELVVKFLDSSNTCIFTISKVFSDSFTELVKSRSDTILIEISETNRDFEFITGLISKIGKAKKYLLEPSRFSLVNDIITIRSEHGFREVNRTLWTCTCDFYSKYNICSHAIAAKEWIKLF